MLELVINLRNVLFRKILPLRKIPANEGKAVAGLVTTASPIPAAYVEEAKPPLPFKAASPTGSLLRLTKS